MSLVSTLCSAKQGGWSVAPAVKCSGWHNQAVKFGKEAGVAAIYIVYIYIVDIDGLF